MGKGSGICDRPGISLAVADGAKTESNFSEGFTSVSEINTGLELQVVKHQWFTKDERVAYHKRKKGWIVGAYSNPICKAFEEYGIIHQQTGTSSYEHTYFPSLKEARKAVNDVAVEAGLDIDARLTRGKYIAYKIGDLPLSIRGTQGHWWAHAISSDLPQSLKKHFNTTQDFRAAWDSTDIRLVHYPTRKAAHQAVINWLAQTITEGK
jgi:hypothetical protein